MEVTDIKDWLDASKTAVDLLKTAYAVMPKGSKRDEIETKVRMAEGILVRSDAKLAKDLGYQLCQCQFPPSIMLYKQNDQNFECGVCGNKVTLRLLELNAQRDRNAGISGGKGHRPR